MARKSNPILDNLQAVPSIEDTNTLLKLCCQQTKLLLYVI